MVSTTIWWFKLLLSLSICAILCCFGHRDTAVDREDSIDSTPKVFRPGQMIGDLIMQSLPAKSVGVQLGEGIIHRRQQQQGRIAAANNPKQYHALGADERRAAIIRQHLRRQYGAGGSLKDPYQIYSHQKTREGGPTTILNQPLWPPMNYVWNTEYQ